ncbi:GSCOCG00011169001-RA-CDS, partial [Cotesia congregata]
FILGYCQCGSILYGIINNEDTKKQVEFTCTITKGSGKCGKRWLRGKKREDTVAEMGEKTVNVYRAEKAEEKMEHGEQEPPNLPSSPVLRTARYEERKKKFLHTDPIQALQILKYTDGKFIIRNIGFDPFYVHYWSRHQLNIFRDYHAREPSCLGIDATGKIMKKLVKYGEIKSKSIYLYHGVIRLNEGQFPVLQMISESQNTNSIHFWLNEWIRSGAPSPSEVVIDGGRAIITGAIRAFTNHSTINEYADACYGPTLPPCYVRMDNAHFIHTWVRLLKNVHPTVSVYYKAAIGKLIMTTSREEAKKIVRNILILSQSETYRVLDDGRDTEAEKSYKYLKALITDGNDFDFDEDDPEKPFEEEIDTDEEEDNQPDDKDGDKTKNKKRKISNQWLEWGNEANNEVAVLKQTEKGDRVNAHFNPAVAKKFIDDLPDLPLWSCVIRDEFGFGRIPASSSFVESDFNRVKNSFLKNEVLPMRVDEYVHKYTKFLNGRLKIVNAKTDEEQKNQDETSQDFDILNHHDKTFDNSEISLLSDIITCPACIRGEKPPGNHKCFICYKPIHNLDSCSSPLSSEEGFSQKRICKKCEKQGNIEIIIASREKENWGGETIKIPTAKNSQTETKNKSMQIIVKKKPAKYLGDQPALINEQIRYNNKNKSKRIVLIKNGSHSDLGATKIDGRAVNAILTCAFDSLYQIIAATICDWPNFQSKVNINFK